MLSKVKYAIVVAVWMFLWVGVSRSETTPTTKPVRDKAAVKNLQMAVKKLNSDRPADIVDAARIIAQSTNDDAWTKLRATIVNPRVLERLEAIKISPGHEGAPREELHADLANLLMVLAGGTPKRAIAALTWLVDHEEYRKTYTREKGGKPWRAYLAYDAFKYIKKPSPKLLEFYTRKLESKDLDDPLKNGIMEALAAHGTAESMVIFKKYLWKYGKPLLLIKHRSNYECVRLLLVLYRGATNKKWAHRMLGMLFQKTYLVSKFWKPVVLPAIRPKGEEAEKFVVLLEGFLKNPGKTPLTDKEKNSFQNLIADIKSANRETPTSQSKPSRR